MPRAGLNRERIAAQAAVVADEMGFDRLTLAAVAVRCGVSLPGLYKHVDGLEAVRRDVAVLKTLGFTPGDLGRAVAWQAATLAVVTLVAGIPLGLVAGRAAWHLFAGQLGVVPGVSTPAVLLALIDGFAAPGPA